MKRGVIVLFVMLLLMPLAIAISSNPFPYECEPGTNTLCQDFGSPFLVESFTLDKDSKEINCPVVFEQERNDDGKLVRKTQYAVVGPEGYFIKPEKPIFLKDVNPVQIEQEGEFPCGREEILEARPVRPVEPFRTHAGMTPPKERLEANAKSGIGVEVTDEGEYKIKSPDLENIDYVLPSLDPPKPIFDISGAVTFIPQFESRSINVLVLLVQFPDQPATVSVADIEKKFFGEGGLSEYYEKQSYGAFKLKGQVAPTWYTLSQNMGYYGGNYESNIEQMITEAIDAARNDIDFTRFDTDQDGVIDGFFVVHAGEPDENGGGNGQEIWSHYYRITPKRVGNVQVIDYETVSEESPVGIIAHEFGHYLGLPDMYDTVFDDGNSKGTGEWSVMGYGGYLEDVGSFDPWSKSYLGWLDENNYQEITEDGMYELVEDTASVGIRYYLMPLSEKEYFMVENRHEHKLMGGDTAAGVLIWHVDESIIRQTGSWNGCSGTRWDCNTVNGDALHKLIDVEEADGKDELDKNELGDKKDTWYYKCGTFGGCQSTIFNAVSTPSSTAYATGVNDVAVAINTESGDVMSLGLSLTGQVFAAPSAEDVSEIEEEDEKVVGVQTGEGSISKKGKTNISLIFIIVFVVIIILTLSFIGILLIKNRQGEIGPREYRQFSR